MRGVGEGRKRTWISPAYIFGSTSRVTDGEDLVFSKRFSKFSSKCPVHHHSLFFGVAFNRDGVHVEPIEGQVKDCIDMKVRGTYQKIILVELHNATQVVPSAYSRDVQSCTYSVSIALWSSHCVEWLKLIIVTHKWFARIFS
jgi:hypothetical protein